MLAKEEILLFAYKLGVLNQETVTKVEEALELLSDDRRWLIIKDYFFKQTSLSVLAKQNQLKVATTHYYKNQFLADFEKALKGCFERRQEPRAVSSGSAKDDPSYRPGWLNKSLN